MPGKKPDDIGREPEAMKKVYAAVKDLTADELARVLDWLMKKTKLSSTGLTGEGGPAGHNQALPAPATPPPGATLTPKAFLTLKKPRDNVQRIACLAYYLTKFRNAPHFKTADLTKLNLDASQPRIPNPSQTAKDATRSQYLTPAGGGKKQITTRGEALVDALPDEAKVKQALNDNPLTRRRVSKKRKKAG